MDPQRKLGVYVSFDSPFIIRYIESLTCDGFRACFEDCYFDEPEKICSLKFDVKSLEII